MFRKWLENGIAHVGLALREADEFVARYDHGAAKLPWWVWVALAVTAILGTTTYGMTMGILGGPTKVVLSAASCTAAAGLAWGVALPTLYVLNSLSGSRLGVSTTFLAALVTTSWGGLAMIASIPINWFFTAAVPNPTFVLLVNLAVFTGVGVAMIDVFGRVMARVEPDRGRRPVFWLLLVGAIGGELFYLFNLFDFTQA